MNENLLRQRMCHVLPGDRDGLMLPLFPGTPLSHTNTLALKLRQFSTAVSLLDIYCCKNNWSEPEYQLYSTLGSDGTLLLIYKVHTYCNFGTIGCRNQTKQLKKSNFILLASFPQRLFLVFCTRHRSSSCFLRLRTIDSLTLNYLAAALFPSSV